MRPKEEKIANERIEILFNQAKKSAKSNPERTRRYIQLAKSIAAKYNIRLGKRYKRLFCKKCNTYFIPSKTVRVRIQSKDKYVTYTCLQCNNIQRYRYIREKKKA